MSSDQSNRKTSRLGRGLAGLVGAALPSAAALPTDAATAETTEFPATTQPENSVGDGDLREIPVGKLQRNPYQPRQDFDAVALQELVDSISTHGILQPLLVRPIENEGYQLIAGERRWLAARQAGLETVPCQVRLYSDQQVYETAMEENLKRENLNPLEQAQAFRRYLDEFDSTIDQLAARLSMNRSTVSNLLRLLELVEPVQKALRSEQITTSHARSLVTLSESDQLSLCARIIEEGLTVRATEQAARTLRDGIVPIDIPVVDENTPVKPPAPSNHVLALQAHLRQVLGTKVEIRLSGQDTGRIVIPFGTNDDFQRVLRILQRRAA